MMNHTFLVNFNIQ